MLYQLIILCVRLHTYTIVVFLVSAFLCSIRCSAKLESDVAEDKTNKHQAAVNTGDDVEASMEADVKPNLEAENLEPSKTAVDEQLEPIEDNDGSDEKNDGTGINEVEDGTGNNEVKDKPGDTENNGSTTTATKPVKGIIWIRNLKALQNK